MGDVQAGSNRRVLSAVVVVKMMDSPNARRTEILKGATAAMQNGQLKAAKALFENAVQIVALSSIEIQGNDGSELSSEVDDSEWEALLGLAEVHWQLGEKVEALSTYERALQLVKR